MTKRLTDIEVATAFHTTSRNLQQTYKNPKPTKQKPIIFDEELAKKFEQYQIVRLGATCKYYGLDEDQLLIMIDLVKGIEKK